MKSAFFTHLSHAEKLFQVKGLPVTYKKRQTLVRSDEPSQWVFFLHSGLVKVIYSLSDGTERLIGYFIPGMVFAQLGSFFEDSSSGMEYEAATDLQVFRLPRTDFLEHLKTDATMSQEYIQAILRNQIFLIERLEYQGEKGIRSKYRKWLLFMAKYYGDHVDKGCTITVPLTQEIIASFLLATRESVNKVTNQFIRQNFISIQDHRLVIHDTEKLRDIV
jgi:CRP-like cAMP-binding protein